MRALSITATLLSIAFTGWLLLVWSLEASGVLEGEIWAGAQTQQLLSALLEVTLVGLLVSLIGRWRRLTLLAAASALALGLIAILEAHSLPYNPIALVRLLVLITISAPLLAGFSALTRMSRD